MACTMEVREWIVTARIPYAISLVKRSALSRTNVLNFFPLLRVELDCNALRSLNASPTCAGAMEAAEFSADPGI